MGYYIETGEAVSKANYLMEYAQAKWIPRPYNFSECVTEDEIAVCVFNNGRFEAAMVVYTEREFHAATQPTDRRPKEWLLVNKEFIKNQHPKLELP